MWIYGSEKDGGRNAIEGKVQHLAENFIFRGCLYYIEEPPIWIT